MINGSQRSDNGGKWRILNLQEKSVSNLFIYYDVETHSSIGNTHTGCLKYLLFSSQVNASIDDVCKMLYFVQLVAYSQSLWNFKYKYHTSIVLNALYWVTS